MLSQKSKINKIFSLVILFTILQSSSIQKTIAQTDNNEQVFLKTTNEATRKVIDFGKFIFKKLFLLINWLKKCNFTSHFFI